ncbi:hypothetical protein B0H34DRAFT_846653 [Crassisporium funariophilum]|nr:hypothetical protein B0H34DRAFT_846653 [Crassisporium funariophilum]
MAATLNIFITGATGYIGGSVLARLLKHPDIKSFQITALVRSSEKAEKLKTLGVETVLGSYTDEDLSFLTEAASKADVVFAMANADLLAPAKAILSGLKKKHETDGSVPVLIHTAPLIQNIFQWKIAIIMDDARGLHGNHKMYSDLDVDALNALPATVVHRNVDIPVVEADQEGYLKSYLIIPGTVYGEVSGPLIDLGIQNPNSIQFPSIIKASIARKQGGYFGKGLNRWPGVEVNNVADLYVVLFDAIRTNPSGVPHGREGYYFAENCEYSAEEVARAISEALVDLGVGTSREPSAFTEEECGKYWKAWTYLATNCYCKADRARALGWKPVHGKEALLASIKPAVALVLKTLQPKM